MLNLCLISDSKDSTNIYNELSNNNYKIGDSKWVCFSCSYRLLLNLINFFGDAGIIECIFDVKESLGL